MKSLLNVLLLCGSFVFTSCEKEDSGKLGGSQSPIGEVGQTIGSSSAVIAGVSSIEAEVTSLENGVSSYTGTAVVTNSTIKNIISNFTGTEIEGDNVTVTDLKFKITSAGIECVNGLSKGILVKYDSEVGDSYSTSDGKRSVVSKSTDNDFPYGFMNIKVIEIEENIDKFGVSKISYWANHRFGLVAMEFTFDDNSTARFPVYASAENN